MSCRDEGVIGHRIGLFLIVVGRVGTTSRTPLFTQMKVWGLHMHFSKFAT